MNRQIYKFFDWHKNTDSVTNIVRILLFTVSIHKVNSAWCFAWSQVLCVGPTGTGKTLTTADKLLKGMPSEFVAHLISFSARTSANQTQDIIDSKLDKRCVHMYRCRYSTHEFFYILVSYHTSLLQWFSS